MKFFKRLGVLTLGCVLAACGKPTQPSITGIYISRGGGFSELLQLTQTQDGQLLGSMQSVTIKPNGTMQHQTSNVSGSTDGKTSLTLVLKANEAFSSPVNLSGQIDGTALVISIQTPSGTATERFVPGTVEGFQQQDQSLANQGTQVAQQANHVAAVQQMNKRAEDVTAQMDQMTDSIQRLSPPDRLLGLYEFQIAQGERNLREEQAHRANGTQAENGQAVLSRGQVSLVADQVQMLNNQTREQIATDRRNFQTLDAAIAGSPCLMSGVKTGDPFPDMGVCKAQARALGSYQQAKNTAGAVLAQRETIMRDETQKMAAIAQEAGLHPRN